MLKESYLRRRRIALTGLVAVAAVVGSWAAVSGASASSTTPAAPTSASSVATLTASRGLPGIAPNGQPGSLPAARPVTYPAGVTPATTSPFDIVQDVSCFHAGDCVAVGDNATSTGSDDTPLAYLWNGRAWTALSVPLPSGTRYGYLTSVSCKTGGCLAVGGYQRGSSFYPLEDDWTGARWVQHLPLIPSGAADTYPTSVSCYSASFCVATGGYVPAGHSTELESFAEVYNGSSWRTSRPSLPSSPYAYNEFTTVSCPASNSCLLAGIYASSDNGYFHTLLDSFDGAHWKVLTDASPTPQQGSADYVNSLSCTSPAACVAVGEVGSNATSTTTYHAFAEALNGSAWTLASTGFLASGTQSILDGVSCVSPTFCAAIGGQGPYNWDTTGKGVYALWNGSTWSPHVVYPPSGDGSYLFGVQCLATNYCVASGTEGPYGKGSAHSLAAFYNGNPTWTQDTP
jgi:hypothetical protein